MGKFLLAACALLVAGRAGAAIPTSCPGGYYLPGPTATECVIASDNEYNKSYYSPDGDLKRYACPKGFRANGYCYTYSDIGSITPINNCGSLNVCIRDLTSPHCHTGRIRETLLEVSIEPDNCDSSTNTCEYSVQPAPLQITVERRNIDTITASKGYRVIIDPPIFSIILSGLPSGVVPTLCEPCPKGTYQDQSGGKQCSVCSHPANAATDIESSPMGMTSDSCPWTCDSGYERTDADTCAQRCASGITTLRAGGLSFHLYQTKQTERAIAVKYLNQTCYGSLAAGGASNALNLEIDGETYHTIN